jgi:hypothetical protein
MFELCWPAGLALVLPLLVVCALVLGVPLAAAAMVWGAYQLGAPPLVALPLILVMLPAAAAFERAMDARFNMYWLMRSYAFTRKQALGRTPDLEATLDAHAQRLAQRLAEGVDDEVLVVGHSTGAIMAVAVVARALRLGADRPRPTLSLLTLGQCIPLLASLPPAAGFRRELAELGRAATLHWIDFSAPPDACCFPLCNPVAEPDVLGADAPTARPKLLSPRFAQMFDAAGYRVLRKDKFRMHFQYLMASPRPVEYDYFRITAGARTLGQRFEQLPAVTDFHALRPFGPPRRP